MGALFQDRLTDWPSVVTQDSTLISIIKTEPQLISEAFADRFLAASNPFPPVNIPRFPAATVSDFINIPSIHEVVHGFIIESYCKILLL
jgi:hypothetical protein